MARNIGDKNYFCFLFGSGRFDTGVPVRSSAEFGRLPKRLNSMIDKLDEAISKLKTLERSVRRVSSCTWKCLTRAADPIFAVQGMLETLLSGALLRLKKGMPPATSSNGSVQYPAPHALIGDL